MLTDVGVLETYMKNLDLVNNLYQNQIIIIL